MSDMSMLLYLRNAKRRMAPYAASIGVALNMLLLWLILTKSTATMRSFKKVLFLTCISELTFSAMNFVFVFTVTVVDGTYFCVIEGIFGHLSPFWTGVGYDGFLYFVYASVSNNTVVFFYRYLVVCRSKTLNAGLFMCCVGAGWSLILLYISALSYKFVTEPIDSDVHNKLTKAGYPSNGNFNEYISCTVERFADYVTYGAVPFTTIAYFAVITMSFAVQRNFKRLQSLMSSAERRFHSEITMVLWVEATTPFVTVVLPIYYDISKIIIPNMPFNWFAEFIWLLTLLGPSFTAIVKLLSIKAFRDYLHKCIYKLIYNKEAMVQLTTVSGSKATLHSSFPKSHFNNGVVMHR